MPYKNPPKTTRFHIGKSGNPFGRMPEITNKDLYHNLRILRMLVDIAMQHLRQKGQIKVEEQWLTEVKTLFNMLGINENQENLTRVQQER